MNRNWICRSDSRFLHSHDPSTTHSWFIHQIIFVLFPFFSLSFQFFSLSFFASCYFFFHYNTDCNFLLKISCCNFLLLHYDYDDRNNSFTFMFLPPSTNFNPLSLLSSLTLHFHALVSLFSLSFCLSLSLILFLLSLFWLLLVSMIRPLIVSKKKGKRWWWSGS